MLLATKDYSRIILIDCACECVTTHSQVYVVRMVCIVCVYVCMCCLSLQLMDVRNAVVVVSRWYGGVHLGPDRFKHINNCARTVIQDTHIGLTVSSGAKESLLCARVAFHYICHPILILRKWEWKQNLTEVINVIVIAAMHGTAVCAPLNTQYTDTLYNYTHRYTV